MRGTIPCRRCRAPVVVDHLKDPILAGWCSVECIEATIVEGIDEERAYQRPGIVPITPELRLVWAAQRARRVLARCEPVHEHVPERFKRATIDDASAPKETT